MTLAFAQELNMYSPASTHMSKQFFTYIRLYRNIYTNSNIGQ